MIRTISFIVALIFCIGCNNNEDKRLIHYMDTGKFELAKKRIDSLLAHNKQVDDQFLLYDKAWIESQLGHSDTAITYYILYLGTNSSDSRAWNNLGNAFQEVGNERLALKSFQNAHRLSPNDKIPLFNVAAMYYNLGKFDSAYTAINEALINFNDSKLNSSDSLLFAKILSANGKNEEAIRIFKNINYSKYGPKEFEIYSSTMEQMGKIERSFEIAQTGMKYFPEDVYILNRYSFLLIVYRKNFDNALSYVNRSIAKDSLITNDAYHYLCLIYKEEGKKGACCAIAAKLSESNIKIYKEVYDYCF